MIRLYNVPLVNSSFNSYLVLGARVRCSRQNHNSTRKGRTSEVLLQEGKSEEEKTIKGIHNA